MKLCDLHETGKVKVKTNTKKAVQSLWSKFFKTPNQKLPDQNYPNQKQIQNLLLYKHFKMIENANLE